MLDIGADVQGGRPKLIGHVPSTKSPMTNNANVHELPDSLAWAMVDSRVTGIYLGGSGTIARSSASDVDIFCIISAGKMGGLIESARGLVAHYLSPQFPVHGPSFLHGYGLQFKFVDVTKSADHAAQYVDLFFNSEDTFTANQMMANNVVVKDTDEFLKRSFCSPEYSAFEQTYAENLAVSLLWSHNKVHNKARSKNEFLTQKAFLELVEVCLEASYSANAFECNEGPFYTAMKSVGIRKRGYKFLGVDPFVNRDFERYREDADNIFKRTVDFLKGTETGVGSAINRLST
jgi:hypothetical protein